VDISRNDGVAAYKYPNAVYYDLVAPNTAYSYQIKAYNNALVPSASIQTVSIVSLPVLSSLYLGPPATDTSNSIQINFTGAYSYVKVYRNSTLIVSKLNTGVYNDTGLSPDVSYSYSVIPYNNQDVSGVSLTIAAITQPMIFDVAIDTAQGLKTTLSGSATAILDVSGQYAYYNVTRTGGSGQGGGTVTMTGNTYLFTDISLAANTAYSYVFTPFTPINSPNYPLGLNGATSMINFTSLGYVTVSIGTITATTIQLLFFGNYAYLTGTVNGANMFPTAQFNNVDTSYTCTGLAGNTTYQFTLTAFNSASNGNTPVTFTANTLGIVTAAAISYYDSSLVYVDYSGNYQGVNVYRNSLFLTTVMGSNITRYIDNVIGNATYTYGVQPYSVGNIVSTSTIVTLPALTSVPTLGKTSPSSLQLLFAGQFDRMAIYSNSAQIATAYSADTSYTMTFLVPNTAYAVQFVPYNSKTVQGIPYTSTFYTDASLMSFYQVDATVSTILFAFSGIYSGFAVYRDRGPATAPIYTSNIMDVSFTDINLSYNTAYNYQLVPFNLIGTPGIPYVITGKTSVSLFVKNGLFNVSPSLSNSTISSWSVTNGTGNKYYVINTGVANLYNVNYRGTLPSMVNTYFVASNSAANQTQTLSQSINISGLTAPTSFLLAFYAFPGFVINPGHQMSVYFGTTLLVKNATFGNSNSSPYYTFNLPFTVQTNGNYALSFVFSCPTASISNICVANVQIYYMNSTPSVKYYAIDPYNLSLYYAFDMDDLGTDLVSISDYSSGFSVLDASLNNGASLSTTAPAATVGTASLKLVSSLQQYMSINTPVTIPAMAAGAGFSVACWMYANGPQQQGGTVFSFMDASSQETIALKYVNLYGQSGYVNLMVGGAYEWTGYNYPLPSNTWNFFAMTVACSASNAVTYTIYMNNVAVQSSTVSLWPAVLTYNTNALGYGSALGMTYFNGNVDEVRMYNRALSYQDVNALYNYGIMLQNTQTYVSVDPSALSIYYDFQVGKTFSSVPALALSNGSFNVPQLPVNTVLAQAPLQNWTFSTGTNYNVYNGSAPGYSYGLPNGITQYVGVKSSTVKGVTTFTMSQTVTLPANAVNYGQYILSFFAFPLDNTYQGIHNLSVYLGNAVILSNYTFTVSPNTVPYNSFQIPFTLVAAGSYVIKFVFSNYAPTTSIIGLTGIQINSANIAGSAWNVLDTAKQVYYYPFTTSVCVSGNVVYDYAQGFANADASLNGTTLPVMVTGSPSPNIGKASLLFNSAQKQYVTLPGTLTLASAPSVGDGFSIAGWIYPIGTQPMRSTIYSLAGANNAMISLSFKSYQGKNVYLDFLVNGGIEYACTNYPITMGSSWYFFAMTVYYNGNNTATYNFYLNGSNVATKQGLWPSVTSYTTNLLGFGTSSQRANGYYNGALQEFRVYNRALNSTDVNSLSTFGTTQSPNYCNIIDVTNIVMYYPFDKAYGNPINPVNAATNNISVDLTSSNGLFNIPLLPANTASGVNPGGLRDWSFSVGATYYLYNGSAAYATTLPTGITQYLGMVSNGSGNNASTMSQTFTSVFSSSSGYVLNFYAFPADGSYNFAHTLSVTVGSITLLNKYSFAVRNTTVPYVTFSIPFTLPVSGTYPLTFSFSNTTNTTGSIICLAGVQVMYYSTGMASTAVDASNLVLYYPCDSGTTNGTTLYNYATGVGVADASLNGNASLVLANTNSSVASAVGSGYVSLSASSQQTVSIGAVTVPIPYTSTGVSVGFTMSCWFYPVGSQSKNATLFSLFNASNLGMSVYYDSTNAWLDLSINGVPDMIPYMYPVAANSWNFLVVTGSCLAGMPLTGATYSMYLNNVALGTMTGKWVDITSVYNRNTLGGSSVAQELGYFNGYLSDVRWYNRTLSVQDIQSLWSYAYTTTTGIAPYGNIIDTAGLQVYYPFEQATYVNYYAFFNLQNGSFAQPAGPRNSISNAKIGIPNWQFSNNAVYYLCNGSILYSYGLPSNVTQYVAVASLPAGGTVTMTQTVPLTIYNNASNSNYMLSFNVFPADNSYNALHTLTVSIGGIMLLNNVSLTASARTVPYSTFNMPFTITTSGNYPLTFSWSNPANMSTPSTMALTNIRVYDPTVAGAGYSIVDTSGLALYYPFDMSSGIINTNVYDFSTGTAVANGTAYGGASVGFVMPIIGTGYLSLSAVSNQYVVSTSPVNIPTVPSVGSGISVTGWFYPVGSVQVPNACLFSILGSTGNISMYYNRSNNYLDFSGNGVPEFICNDLITPNTWNFFAVLISYQGAGANGTTYTYILNNVGTQLTGSWPNLGTFSSVTLGNAASIGLGNYSGFMDDFRVYTRALSLKDVGALWNYGMISQAKFGNIINPTSLQIYYPFDQGSTLNYFGLFNTISVINGGFLQCTPAPVSNGRTSLNPTLTGWTIQLATGSSYVVGNGSSMYAYGLPANASQYIAITTSQANTAVRMYQYMTLILTNTQYSQYTLSFTVFPMDNAYSNCQTISVMVGKVVLLNQVVFNVSTSSVPYTSFTLPFTLNDSGSYSLMFIFNSNSSTPSTLCVTGISVNLTGPLGALGSGYNAIDTRNLAMYYPFDNSTYTGTLISDYATGTGVVDASMSSTGMIVSTITASNAPIPVGTGCLSLTSTSGQYVTLTSAVLAAPQPGAGMSFSGWFFPVGADQASNAALFSFQNGTGATISCYYNSTNNWLSFSANPGKNYVAWTYRVVPYTWNFFVWTIGYNATATDGSNANYTYYLNGNVMATLVGVWPNNNASTIFNQNTLGYGTGLGFFNGYMDDFRVYTRELSLPDVNSLWAYGTQISLGGIYGNIVDMSGLQVYYTFNQGSYFPVYVPNVTFLGYTMVSPYSITFTYSNPTTFYYATIVRISGNGVYRTTGAPVAQSIGVTTFTDTGGLTASTAYTYYIVPYSELGIAGVPTLTPTAMSPTPSVTVGSLANTTTSITLNLLDNTTFSYVNIARLKNGYVDSTFDLSVGTITYIDRNVTANNRYAYTVTSYNAISVSGGVITSPASSPLPTVSFGSYTTVVSSNITFTFSSSTTFSYVMIAPIQLGVVGTYVKLPPGVTSYTDPAAPFYADVSYSYSIVPYNALDVSGAAIRTPLTDIPASVAFSQYSSISSNGLTVNFVNGISFEYVTIARLTNGVYGSYSKLAVGATSYTDSLLSSQAYYSYSIVPYNAIDVSSTEVVTPPISPSSQVAFGSYTEIYSNHITFTLANPSAYSTLSIARISGGVMGPYVPVSVGAINYIDVNTFYADISYAYSIIPYNSLGVAGQSIITPATTIVPVVTFNGFSNINTQSVTINFTYLGITVANRNIIDTSNMLFFYTYETNNRNNYIYIARITNGRTGTYIKVPSGSTSFVDSSSAGMLANTSYTYSIIPYNLLDVSGSTIFTTTVSLTPTVAFGSYTLVSTNQIILTYSGSYSYVTIARITNGVLGSYVQQPVGSTTLVDTGPFYANITYAYSIVPYNAVNAPGTTVTSYTTSLAPSVTFNTYANTTSVSPTITFGVPTNYFYVAVARVTNGTVGPYQNLPVGATSFTDTSLNPYYYYTYSLIPYNAVNVSGGIVSTLTPISPDPSVTFNGYTNISYSNISLSFSGATSYNYVTVSRYKNGALVTTVPLNAGVGTFSDNALFTADSSYAYVITPFNAFSNYGPSWTTYPVSTVPLVAFSKYNEVTTTGLKVNFTYTASYEYVYIARVTAGVVGTYTKSNMADSSFIDTGMTANVLYAYSIIPFNGIDVSNSAIRTPNVSVVPTFISANYTNMTITGSAYSMTLPTTTSYYNVSVACISGGLLQSYVNVLPGATSYTLNGNFYPDISYAFSILPYNAAGAYGSAFITYAVSPVASFIVANYSNQTITGSTYSITLPSALNYYDISVACISGGTLQSYVNVLPGASSYSLSGTYYADISYAFSILPYNAVNQVSTVFITSAVSPAPVFRSGDYTSQSITGTAFTISLPFTTDYYDVSVACVSGGTLQSYVGLVPGQSSYTLNGTYYPNISYTFSFLPFNAVNQVGSPFVTAAVSPVSSFTAANYGTQTITSTTYSVVLPPAMNYYDVSVVCVSGGIVQTYVPLAPRVTSYSLTGNYYPDISYSFLFLPFNAVNTNGSYFVTNAVSPVPSFTTSNYGSQTITNASYTVLLPPAMNYYDVSVACISGGILQSYVGVLPGASSYTFNATFYADISYAFSIMPYNAVNQNATPLITTAVSPASIFTLANYGTQTITSSAYSIVLPYSMNYYDVSIACVSGGKVQGYVGIPPKTTSYTYSLPGYYHADVSYAFSILPYNAVNTLGIGIVSTGVSPAPTFTASNYAYSVINDSTLSFNLLNLSSFYDVSVALITDNSMGIYSQDPYYGMAVYQKNTSYSATNGPFYADASYAFSIVAYNAMLQPMAVPYITAPISVTSMVMAMAYGNPTTSSPTVNFAYGLSFEYVTLSRITNGVAGAYSKLAVAQTSFVDSGLTSNNYYAYSIIPYNAIDVSGVPITTTRISPTAVFNSSNCGSPTLTSTLFSITLPATTNYYDVSVACVSGGIVQSYANLAPGTLSYSLPGNYYPGINYVFSFIPYNALNIPGGTYRTNAVSLPSSFTSANYSNLVINYTSFSFTIPAAVNYYDISVACISGGILQPYAAVTPYASTYSLVGNYYADISYAFSILPFNGINVAGSPFITPVVSPVPTFIANNYGTQTITGSAYTITLPSALNYYDVSVACISGGTLQSYVNVAPGASSYTYTNNFYADISYAFSILPYNAVNQVGTAFITAAVSPLTTFTPANYSGLTINSTTFSVTLLAALNYYDVSVACISGGILQSYANLAPTRFNYTYNLVGNYYADISYAFSILPYNAVNQPGTALITGAVSPATTFTLANYNALSITGSTFSITLLPALNYYDVSVACISGGSLQGYVGLAPTTANYTYNLGGNYYADISYAFSILPYNAVNQVGPGYMTPGVSPATTFTSSNYSALTITGSAFSITLLPALNYYDVSVACISGGSLLNYVGLPPTTANYTYNLAGNYYPDISYAFAILPYNAVNQVGPVFITPGVSSSTTFISANYSGLTMSSTNFSITLLPALNYYDVSVACISGGSLQGYVGLAPTTANYTYNLGGNYYPDISYAFSILPYNAANQVGPAFTTPIVSAATTFTSANYSDLSITGSTFSVTLLPALNYYDVSVACISGGFIQGYVGLAPTTANYTYNLAGNYYPDISYAFSILPYNAANQVGPVFITPVVSPATTFTSGNYSALTITGTAMSITLLPALNYYDVSVACISGGSLQGYVDVAPTTSNYTYNLAGNYYPDISYAFSILPYNVMNQVGPQFITPAVSPATTFTSANYSALAITGSAFSITLLAALNYYDVSVACISGGSLQGYVGLPPSTTDYTYNLAGNYYPDISYSFAILPYNVANQVGSVFITPAVSPASTFIPANYSALAITGSTFSITFLASLNYYDVSVACISGGSLLGYVGLPPTTANYTYNLAGNYYADISYAFAILPYNAVNQVGPVLITDGVSPVPTFTSANYSNQTMTSSLYSVTFPPALNYYDVSVAFVNGGVLQPYTGLSPGAPSYSLSGVYYPDISYAFSIIPFNAVGALASSLVTTPVSATSTFTASNYSYGDISSNYIIINLTNTRNYYSLGVARITAGVTGTVYTYPGTTVTINDTGLVPNTQYAYSLQSNNILTVAGGAVTTTTVYTNAIVTVVNFSSSSNTITGTVVGYYNSYRWTNTYNNNTGVVNSGAMFVDNLGLITGITYTYTILPFNVISTPGYSYLSGIVKLAAISLPFVNDISNGLFANPIITSNGYAYTPAINYWTFSAGASYFLYSGSTAYSGSLPIYISQYVGMVSVQTPGGGVSTMSQTMFLPSAAKYMASFYAFPADNSYNATHTLSVSVGNMTLLNKVSLAVSASSVPYTPFNLLFSVPAAGYYPLTFTYTNINAIVSTICVTNVQVISTADYGTGYTVVDITGLTLYYNMDVSGVTGTSFSNFSSGIAYNDATLMNGASITSKKYIVGTGSLALTASASQYMTVGAFSVPNGTVGSGVTFTGWFYPLGSSQASYATLFSMSGSGGKISVSYAGSNPWLDLSVNGGIDYAPSANVITPNVWNFFAYTIVSNGMTATYSYYINNVLAGSVVGNYPSTLAYTINTLGYGGAGTGYFNGYLDEFRAYSRVLTVQEIGALWNYGTTQQSAFSVIDTKSMVNYYQF